jgi:SWI/SNF-related matrix-associated actin-dependent regulator of chromatin subfamily A3
MKEPAGRQCACGDLLRLPDDAIEVIPPSEALANEELTANDPPKRAARKKYVRPAGEKPSLSTKMQYLHDQLIRYSRQNPHSANYNVFEVDEDMGEDTVLGPDGKPEITKSVVL